MLADKRLPVDDQSDRVLQVRTQGQHRTLDGQIAHRAGSVSARTAQNHRTEYAGARNGVVHAARDRALANQKCIGNSGEPLQCIRIFICDRFAGAVGAGHHQIIRSAGGKEQMM